MSDRRFRAKFFVTSIGKTTFGGSIKLSAVCRGEDNKVWAAATPSGMIDMTVLTTAIEGIEPGDEYYVDFTPAPKGQQGMDL